LIKDQYGSTIDSIAPYTDSNNNNVTYRVYASLTTDATSGVTLTGQTGNFFNAADAAATPSIAATVTDTGVTTALAGTVFTDGFAIGGLDLAKFNKGFHFNSTNLQTGKLTFKTTIQRKVGSGNWTDVSSAVSRTFEAVANSTSLTYSLGTISNIYASIANKSLFTGLATYTGPAVTPTPAGTSLVGANADFLAGRSISVSAKDAAGNTVAIPNNGVKAIYSSDANVISAAYPGANDGYLVGNNAGTATVSAVVYTNKGTTVNLSQQVTVKADSISTASLTTDNTTSSYFSDTAKTIKKTSVYSLFNTLHVFDNYGTEYKGARINEYNNLLGVYFLVSDVQGGTVTVAADGTLNVQGDVQNFVVTAMSANGKSVQVVVTK
jgi:hypothetical protein